MTLLFFPMAKSVAFWVVWLAVGGSSVGGSGFNGSCRRYDDTFDKFFGALQWQIAVTRLINNIFWPVLIRLFFKKRSG